MDLFGNHLQRPISVINTDGEALYYGALLNFNNADDYFDKLLNSITWSHDQALIQGTLITTSRKVAWYADRPFQYRYSNTTKIALPWTKELLELKSLAEEKTSASYNSCLLNLYHNGNEGMAWHSDAEKELKSGAAICSLSLGAERKFSFKHKKTKEIKSLVLKHGSCLVMKGATQRHWLHRLPPTKVPMGARINLTFRTMNG